MHENKNEISTIPLQRSIGITIIYRNILSKDVNLKFVCSPHPIYFDIKTTLSNPSAQCEQLTVVASSQVEAQQLVW